VPPRGHLPPLRFTYLFFFKIKYVSPTLLLHIVLNNDTSHSQASIGINQILCVCVCLRERERERERERGHDGDEEEHN
jgi:hypothetical protein